jgi:hypothetical protein
MTVFPAPVGHCSSTRRSPAAKSRGDFLEEVELPPVQAVVEQIGIQRPEVELGRRCQR